MARMAPVRVPSFVRGACGRGLRSGFAAERGLVFLPPTLAAADFLAIDLAPVREREAVFGRADERALFERFRTVRVTFRLRPEELDELA